MARFFRSRRDRKATDQAPSEGPVSTDQATEAPIDPAMEPLPQVAADEPLEFREAGAAPKAATLRSVTLPAQVGVAQALRAARRKGNRANATPAGAAPLRGGGRPARRSRSGGRPASRPRSRPHARSRSRSRGRPARGGVRRDARGRFVRSGGRRSRTRAATRRAGGRPARSHGRRTARGRPGTRRVRASRAGAGASGRAAGPAAARHDSGWRRMRRVSPASSR